MRCVCFADQPENFDDMTLEEQHYHHGDGGMNSPKNKLLLRDAKKELMRYIVLSGSRQGASREGPGAGLVYLKGRCGRLEGHLHAVMCA